MPIVFFQDVQGFMVGKQAEQSGIIRSGAKLVNVVSNSVVPKFTVIVGGSFGAGSYALCGKAYDPADCRLAGAMPSWAPTRPPIRFCNSACRGGTRRRAGFRNEKQRFHDEYHRRYEEQTDIRYGAARGWVDAIIAPHETRQWLEMALKMVPEKATWGEFRTGVLQM